MNSSEMKAALDKLQSNWLLRTLLQRYPWARVVLFLFNDHPDVCIGLIAFGMFLVTMIPVTVLILVIGMQDVNAEQSVVGDGLPNDVQPGVIPAAILPDLEAAALKWRVPLQFLAGESETESSFNPNAKNYNANIPTHAGGMFQFEPGTWNGYFDPITASDVFDTDPTAVATYGGYGVDANGDGTADPFDPADASMAAAHYLRNLYDDYKHSWNLASYWYGSETQNYVSTVLNYTASFVDKDPAEKTGGAYWFVGGKDNVSVTDKTTTSLTLSTPQWAPIYAPLDGSMTVQYKASGDILTWTDGSGSTSLTFSGGLVAFAPSGTAVNAGDVIGFTTVDGLTVKSDTDPLAVVGGSLPKWVKH